jgi:flagellar protein FliO/FliZ
MLRPSHLVPLSFLFTAAAAGAAEQAGPASAGSLLQVLFGLIAVLALMAGAAWLLRRFGLSRISTPGSVRIVGGVSVGTRERVMVVEVADQWIVVGVAPGRVSALATMAKQETAAPPEGAAAAEPAKNFSAWLKQTIDKRNGQ